MCFLHFPQEKTSSHCIFFEERRIARVLLAGENLSLALLGRKNHSIVFSVGGKMLTAVSLHCICSRREDAHL